MVRTSLFHGEDVGSTPIKGTLRRIVSMVKTVVFKTKIMGSNPILSVEILK